MAVWLLVMVLSLSTILIVFVPSLTLTLMVMFGTVLETTRRVAHMIRIWSWVSDSLWDHARVGERSVRFREWVLKLWEKLLFLPGSLVSVMWRNLVLLIIKEQRSTVELRVLLMSLRPKIIQCRLVIMLLDNILQWLLILALNRCQVAGFVSFTVRKLDFLSWL